MAQLIVAGNATPDKVLTGNKFSSGVLMNADGTMANNGALNYTPTASNQTVPAGFTTGGTVSGVTVPAANVLVGTTIAGTAGTMPDRGTVNYTPSTVNQTVSSGKHSGSGVVYGDANLVAGNIAKNVTIFGVVGTFDQSVNILQNDQRGFLGSTAQIQRRFTMTVSAEIILSVSLYNSNVNGYMHGRWQKNGIPIGFDTTANNQTRVVCSVTASCVAGDVFELSTYGENTSVWQGNEFASVKNYVATSPIGGTINL